MHYTMHSVIQLSNLLDFVIDSITTLLIEMSRGV